MLGTGFTGVVRADEAAALGAAARRRGAGGLRSLHRFLCPGSFLFVLLLA